MTTAIFCVVPPRRLEYLNNTPLYRLYDGDYKLYSNGDRPLHNRIKSELLPAKLYIRKTDENVMFEELKESWTTALRENLTSGNIKKTKELIKDIAEDTIFSDPNDIISSKVEAVKALVDELIDGSNIEMLKSVLAISDKDYSTLVHSVRVMSLGISFAMYLKWSKRKTRIFALACLTHDIGKTQIPDEILKSDKQLTDEEYTAMRAHTVIGAVLLERVDFGNDKINDAVRDVAMYHHEKLDGSGYHGKKGNQISKFCRIVAIIDCHEALTSDTRTYRDPMSCYDACEYLVDEVNTGKYDLNLFKEYVKHLNPEKED